jgi:ribosomal-protein-alanine N-acetyltransferase
LERAIPEAPHWREEEYRVIFGSGKGSGEEVNPVVTRRLFVAEAEGKLLGFAVGKVIGSSVDRVSELESIAVEKSGRRIGVGKALCNAVIAWSRAQNSKVLELEVRAESAGAIALYSGLGFVTMGRRPGYYRQPVDDAVLMRLDLTKTR